MKELKEEKRISIFGRGNKKLSNDLLTFSMTPIKSCCNCKTCKSTCFAMPIYRLRKNVRDKWDNNYRLSKTKEFTKKFIEEIKARKGYTVRLFGSGDAYNKTFINKLYKAIKATPNTYYFGYTKNFAQAKILNELPNCNIINSFINGFRNYGSEQYCQLLKQKFNAHICSLDEDRGQKCGNHCKACYNIDKVCFIQHGMYKNDREYENKVIEHLKKLPDYKPIDNN